MATINRSENQGVDKSNNVLKLHHHAYRTRDIEATRHFYEDILGMPLVAAFVETWDGLHEKPTNYIHAYFELVDGSSIAFFCFPEDQKAPSKIGNGGTEPTDPFDHHISCEVDGMDAIREMEARVKAAGIDHFAIDHGYCYSLYLIDPNQMHFELTTNLASTDATMREQRLTARKTLEDWRAGKTIGNNALRVKGAEGAAH